MRSASADPRVLMLAFALAAAGSVAAAPASTAASAAASAPADATSQPAGFVPGARALAIEAEVRRLREDPLLAGRHVEHRLEWIPDPDKLKKRDYAAWFKWMKAFMRFLNDTSRILLYGLAVVAVAVLAVGARRFVQLRAARRGAARQSAVSHVRDLDVRPESLPDDVGGAAWTLWQDGQVADALSLLYRGALSRLIHRHEVPIAASTTEGECLELAHGRLAAPALRYLTQLVRAREAKVYGERELSLAMGETLCSGFATRLDAPAATEAAA